MRELDLESKSVENFVGTILQFELIGVLIKLENLEDLGNNIEIFLFLRGFLEFGGVGIGNDVALCKVLSSPFFEGVGDGAVLSLLGRFLSGEGIW